MPNRSLVRINSVNTSFSQLLNISGSSSTPSTSTTTASSSPSVCFSNNQTQYNNTTSINSITITKQNLTSNDDKAKFNSNALANSLNEIKLKVSIFEKNFFCYFFFSLSLVCVSDFLCNYLKLLFNNLELKKMYTFKILNQSKYKLKNFFFFL